MWIVRLALRRPYSFTVMAILIVLVGVVTITRMSTDIFPNINIPVVSMIWSYAGVAPEEMEKRDFGDRIEIIDGLKENTKVVMNPTDDLREGIHVEVKSTEEPKPPGAVAQSVSSK